MLYLVNCNWNWYFNICNIQVDQPENSEALAKYIQYHQKHKSKHHALLKNFFHYKKLSFFTKRIYIT